jgi:hypothetical protein
MSCSFLKCTVPNSDPDRFAKLDKGSEKIGAGAIKLRAMFLLKAR